jgi:hypothetical protein
MQKLVILAVLVVLLVSGSVLALSFKKQFSESNNAVLSPSNTPTPETQDSLATQSAEPEITVFTPSNPPRPTSKPTSEPSNSTSSSLQKFVYPGSTIVSSSPTNITLESRDDTIQIVDWYKAAMKRENAQIKNTVVNTVNGKTTATLTVSTNGHNMYVTITHSDAVTSIKLEQK